MSENGVKAENVVKAEFAKERFEIGDVVALKSQPLEMTVTGAVSRAGKQIVSTAWLNTSGDPYVDELDARCLRLVRKADGE